MDPKTLTAFKNIAKPLSEIAKNYDYREPPSFLLAVQEFITNAFRYIAELLSLLKLTPGAADSRATATIVQFIVIAVGIICLIFLLVVVAGKLRHIKNAKQLASSGLIQADIPLDRVGWRNLAIKLAEEKNYRDSVRAIYMSALYLLDEKGVIRFSPSKTNYEYFYALGAKNVLQDPFRKLVTRVESIWFGHDQAQEEDHKICLRQLQDMEDLVLSK
jgi:hypothetical protein